MGLNQDLLLSGVKTVSVFGKVQTKSAADLYLYHHLICFCICICFAFVILTKICCFPVKTVSECVWLSAKQPLTGAASFMLMPASDLSKAHSAKTCAKKQCKAQSAKKLSRQQHRKYIFALSHVHSANSGFNNSVCKRCKWPIRRC